LTSTTGTITTGVIPTLTATTSATLSNVALEGWTIKVITNQLRLISGNTTNHTYLTVLP
jgi:hypothetical protein